MSDNVSIPLPPTESAEKPSIFPYGLRVFLRTTNVAGDLHNIDFPQATSIGTQWKDDLFIAIWNGEGIPLAFFLPEAISFIIPLSIVGPSSDAKD